MAVFDIIQDAISPIRHTVKRKIFANMMPNITFGELVEETDDMVKINTRPFDIGVAMKLLGSKSKVNALFTVFSWHGGVSFRKFFTFEFIKMLEAVKYGNFRYGINIDVVDKCLEYFKPDENQIVEIHDIDRKRIRDLFNFSILDHQETIIRSFLRFKYIQKYRGMLMHAGAGVGKTASSLFIMEGMYREVDNVVVICPLPTVNDVWKKSIGEENNVFKKPQDYWWVGDSKLYDGQKYIICHYEGLEKLQSIFNKFPKGRTGVIIDESHNLNDPKSKRTQLAIDFVNKVESSNVLLLSGTPLKSGFREMGLLFKLLDSNFDTHTEKRYITLYSSPSQFMSEVLRERYDGYAVKVSKDAIKLDPLNTVNLKVTIPESEMKQYYLSNIKEDLKEYVSKRSKELKEQEPYWTERYLTLREQAIQNGKLKGRDLEDYIRDVDKIRKTKSVSFGQLADVIERVNKYEKNYLIPNLITSEDKKIFKEAKTIYKYPVLKVQGEALANVIGKARIRCHIALAEYLDFISIINSSKKKTIIFSNYVDVCKAAEQICTNLGYNPICVFGEETKNLASNVDKFLNSKNINPLITTYKSLSTGVPLVAADTIICLDMPFRMYIYEQAVARAWRLGQDSQVTSYIIEANTDVPNINSRNLDIITWYKEEVERITGVSSSVDIKGDSETIGFEEGEFNGDVSQFRRGLGLEELSITVEAPNPKRKAVEDFIIKYIGKIVTGDQNVNLYREMFKRMNDKDFDQFMVDLRDGKKHLTIIIPNGMKEIKTDLQNNMKIAKELGFEFYQRLQITGSKTMPDYITPNKYLVVKLPVKRASQLLSKKISIPKDNKSRDLLTGQVTGDSRAAKLTNPEVQILLGLGLESSIKELMKFRGGDLGAGTALNNDLMRYGRGSQANSANMSTGVVSTKTLKQFFQAMHIRSTL